MKKSARQELVQASYLKMWEAPLNFGGVRGKIGGTGARGTFTWVKPKRKKEEVKGCLSFGSVKDSGEQDRELRGKKAHQERKKKSEKKTILQGGWRGSGPEIWACDWGGGAK